MFRIWDRMLGEFVENGVFLSPAGVCHVLDPDTGEVVMGDAGRYIVDRWTGMYDVHGIPIFEYDIVSYRVLYDSMLKDIPRVSEITGVKVLFQGGEVTPRYGRNFDSVIDRIEITGNAYQPYRPVNNHS